MSRALSIGRCPVGLRARARARGARGGPDARSLMATEVKCNRARLLSYGPALDRPARAVDTLRGASREDRRNPRIRAALAAATRPGQFHRLRRPRVDLRRGSSQRRRDRRMGRELGVARNGVRIDPPPARAAAARSRSARARRDLARARAPARLRPARAHADGDQRDRPRAVGCNGARVRGSGVGAARRAVARSRARVRVRAVFPDWRRSLRGLRARDRRLPARRLPGGEAAARHDTARRSGGVPRGAQGDRARRAADGRPEPGLQRTHRARDRRVDRRGRHPLDGRAASSGRSRRLSPLRRACAVRGRRRRGAGGIASRSPSSSRRAASTSCSPTWRCVAA